VLGHVAGECNSIDHRLVDAAIIVAAICAGIMQLISFKQTILLKRGFWLSAAALIAFVMLPSLVDDSLWRNPLPTVIALCVLTTMLGYFLWKLPIHRLADSVFDGHDHLVARRRSIQEIIPLSNIAGVQAFTGLGVHRITIRLRIATRLGRQIEFLPQASLWSSLSGVQQVASDINHRANAAHDTSA